MRRRRAERVPPARVARDLAEEEALDAADDPRALLEPVERVETSWTSFGLLALAGRRRVAISAAARAGRGSARLPSTCTLGLTQSFSLDHGLRALAVDLADRVRLESGRGGRRGSRSGSDRARAPAGRPSGCPRCRTGRRGTGSRSPTRPASASARPSGRLRPLTSCFSLLEREAVHLHRAAEVHAAVREDREARHAVLQAVVADVRRPPRDLALLGVAEEGRDDELALRDSPRSARCRSRPGPGRRTRAGLRSRRPGGRPCP